MRGRPEREPVLIEQHIQESRGQEQRLKELLSSAYLFVVALSISLR